MNVIFDSEILPCYWTVINEYLDAFAVLAPTGPLRRINEKAHEYSDQVAIYSEFSAFFLYKPITMIIQKTSTLKIVDFLKLWQFLTVLNLFHKGCPFITL